MAEVAGFFGQTARRMPLSDIHGVGEGCTVVPRAAADRIAVGEGLLGLTQATQLVPDPSTYGQRSLACVTAPGALVEGFRLTL